MVGLMLCFAYLNGSILKCLEWFTIGSCLLKFCLHFVPFFTGYCDQRVFVTEGVGLKDVEFSLIPLFQVRIRC